MDPREALAHDAEQQQQRILSMKAGSELDALVAETIFSLTPCDEWMPVNFGSAGGPALAKRCDHAPDTCYSTRTLGSIQGQIGGAPRFSEEAGAAWTMLDRFWAVTVERCNSTSPEVVVTIGARDGREWSASGTQSEMPLCAARCALLATLEARPR